MMKETRIDEVRINMLSETVEPELFSIPRNMNLILHCSANLQRLITEQYVAPVSSAILYLPLADVKLTITTVDGKIVSGICIAQRVVLPGGKL